MKEIDKEAKIQPKNEIWVLFDKINNCLSLSLLTEIFINRIYNGETFSENIRLIGTCNPYKIYGLTKQDDNENELVFSV